MSDGVDRTYLFIDGGYLRECYREAMIDFFGKEGELDFMAVKNHNGGNIRPRNNAGRVFFIGRT